MLVVETVIDGDVSRTKVVVMEDTVRLFDAESGSITFKRQLPKFLSALSGGAGDSGASAVAPMPGVVEKVNVRCDHQSHSIQTEIKVRGKGR